MDTSALLSSWEKLVTDVEPFLLALEGGEAGVVHALGDYADDAIQSLVPAYASAVAICKQIDLPELGLSCETERVKLRDTALGELLRVTGMIRLVREAITLYHAVPAAIRTVVRKGAAALHEAGDLITHPSITHLGDTAKATIAYAGSLVSLVPKLYAAAPQYAKQFATWLGGYGSKAAAAIGQLLSEMGGAFAKVGGRLLALGDEAITDVEQIVSLAGHTLSGLAGDVVAAGKTVVHAGEDVVDATLSLADKGVSALTSLI